MPPSEPPRKPTGPQPTPQPRGSAPRPQQRAPQGTPGAVPARPQSTAMPRERPAPVPVAREKEAPALPHKNIRYGIAGAAVLMILLALLFGSIPIKVGVTLLGMCVLQGLWRGASELVGVVVGSLLAIPLAPPIARGLESAIGGAMGTTGLANRFACLAIVAIVIVIAVAAGVSFGVRKYMKTRPQLRLIDQYAGAGLGLVEGCLLLMVALWVPLALEPVAAAQMPAPRPAWMKGEPEEDSRPIAEGVLKMAKAVKESSLGGLAKATNPVDGSRLLGLAADFAAITRDPAAMEFLLESSVMNEIQALPSMQTAMARLKSDPEINEAVFGPDGVTPGFLQTLLASQTILDVFDGTTIVQDVTPFAERLEQAIREATTLIGTNPEGDDPPPK